MIKRIGTPLLVLLSLFLFQTRSAAQIGISNDSELAREASKRKFMVVADELSEKEIKKYKKKGNLKLVQEEFDRRNEKLKKLFAEHWKINPEVVYKTEKELAALQKAKSNEYVYVKLKYMTDMKTKKNMITRMQKTYYYSYYFFTLSLTDSKKTLGTVTSRGPVINDLEYLFAINTLQYFLQYTAEGNKRGDLEEGINAGAHELKKKTLLLPDYLTQLNAAEIKANYPYDVKVVPEKEIIEKINQKDGQYAYAYVNHRFGSCGTRYNHIIVDCGSGRPLILDKRNAIALGTSSQMSIFDDIATLKQVLGKDGSQVSAFKQKFVKAKQLKKYTEIINGKYDDKEEEESGDETAKAE